MSRDFEISHTKLSVKELARFVYQREPFTKVVVAEDIKRRVDASHLKLLAQLEKNIPIYGVTTGFGDSCSRLVSKEQSEALQVNLISYLQCGTGKMLEKDVTRAMCLFRLISLSRGLSGVSIDLIEQLTQLLDHDILPLVPCEGSLGASGDLIPLAYLGELVQGRGSVWGASGTSDAEGKLREHGIKAYKLKPKEGLAIVNGTSTMAAQAFVNHSHLKFLLHLASVATSWLCIVLRGKTTAFGELVNSKAKQHRGQEKIAKDIRQLLQVESYSHTVMDGSKKTSTKFLQRTIEPVQDRYSLRCAPQILGPIYDTLQTFEGWLEDEINGVSDNPLFDPEANDDELASGGNFYGGYLAHGMDYYKVCLGNLADLMDRQLMLLMDDKTAQQLPPNLAAWDEMNEAERHLHHGLKGLHQAVGAITSEVLALCMPNSIFSRSSESHNQDKVSLGMSAAMQCSEAIEKLYSISSLYLVCLAQALDIRRISLQGQEAKMFYRLVRGNVPFVSRDQALTGNISKLRATLKHTALQNDF